MIIKKEHEIDHYLLIFFVVESLSTLVFFQVKSFERRHEKAIVNLMLPMAVICQHIFFNDCSADILSKIEI